jgi:hypothetical protein
MVSTPSTLSVVSTAHNVGNNLHFRSPVENEKCFDPDAT